MRVSKFERKLVSTKAFLLIVVLTPTAPLIATSLALALLFCWKRVFSRLCAKRSAEAALELHLAVHTLLLGLSPRLYTEVKGFAAAEVDKRREELALHLAQLKEETKLLRSEQEKIAKTLRSFRKAFALLRDQRICGRCVVGSMIGSERQSSLSDKAHSAKRSQTFYSTTGSRTPPVHFSKPCEKKCLECVLRVCTTTFPPLVRSSIRISLGG